MKQGTKLLFTILAILYHTQLTAQVRITPENALKKHFAGMEVKRTPVYLNNTVREKIGKAIGTGKIPGFYTFYTAEKNGKITGYAHFDTHKVRTKEETVCIILNPDSSIRQIELVSFYEPEDYAPPERWLKLFTLKKEEELNGIQAMTGATLTARGIINAARRTILVFQESIGK